MYYAIVLDTNRPDPNLVQDLFPDKASADAYATKWIGSGRLFKIVSVDLTDSIKGYF